MERFFFVAFGGAIGASLRYLISILLPKIIDKPAFYATFSVNIIGSFFIGILIALFESSVHNNNLKLFIIVGVLGGFTTFSSFAAESINMFRTGDVRMAFIYIVSSNFFGIIAAFGGFLLVRYFNY